MADEQILTAKTESTDAETESTDVDGYIYFSPIGLPVTAVRGEGREIPGLRRKVIRLPFIGKVTSLQ